MQPNSNHDLNRRQFLGGCAAAVVAGGLAPSSVSGVTTAGNLHLGTFRYDVTAYPQGGYAVSVAWCDPAVDQILSGGIMNLLSRACSSGTR